MMKKLYKKVGDIFEYKGITLQVVKSGSILCKDCPLYLKDIKECNPIKNSCASCYFYEIREDCNTILCCSTERKDHKDVIFKKVQ